MGRDKLTLKMYGVYLVNLDDEDGISEVKVISISPLGKFAKVEDVDDKEHPFWLDIEETDILEQIS